MTERSVTHATFVIERRFEAAPERVFAAWATPEAKLQWFNGPPDWKRHRYELDFRVGGSERSSVGPAGGTAHVYEAKFYDIVPNERIVTAYEMYFDKERISVSLATLELKADGKGTLLKLTEQGAFLDGYDGAASREEGTRFLLDAVEKALNSQHAKA
jgi:uncharacterized protein YndB with AHSA1/START domain